MVIVSHDREFLDQLCTKIVETEFGVATTYKVCALACCFDLCMSSTVFPGLLSGNSPANSGLQLGTFGLCLCVLQGNYTAFTRAKEENIAAAWAAWEKQQKEVARQVQKIGTAVWLSIQESCQPCISSRMLAAIPQACCLALVIFFASGKLTRLACISSWHWLQHNPLLPPLQTDLIARLSGGAQSGRAAAAEKALEKIRSEGLLEKPFIPKKRIFRWVCGGSGGVGMLQVKSGLGSEAGSSRCLLQAGE